MQSVKKLAVAAVILLAGCAAPAAADPCEIYGDCADMSGYSEFANTDGVFFEVLPAELKDLVQTGEPVVAYIGYAECPWCNDALPILNEAALKHDTRIAYINTRRGADVTSNGGMADFSVILELIGDSLETDADGNKMLYAPVVCTFSNGQLAALHMGTVNGYDPTVRDLNEDEKGTLRGIYEDMLSDITE